ncbi:MAG: DUF6164 family protein [Chromatiales bacterium]|jgi:hypothetical protein|nr:DUF6164 family protein [Chromatiales bacterium]
MAKLLMNLRSVPEDEIAEVRALLHEHNIDFYETHPGRWRLSAGGFWIRETTQFARARALLDDYQKQRLMKARADYEARCARGEVETLSQRIARQPVQMLIYAIAIGLVLYLGMTPLLMLLR